MVFANATLGEFASSSRASNSSSVPSQSPTASTKTPSTNKNNSITNMAAGSGGFHPCVGGAHIPSGNRFKRALSAATIVCDDARPSPGGVGVATPQGGARVGEYTLLRQLGDGAYGTVFLATHNRTHEAFAIKRILVDRSTMPFVERQVRRETSLMQGLHHPHVVRLIQVLQTPNAFYFVMELAEGGELFDMIINSHRFSEVTARKYFQQLLSALQYCHGRDVIHRDLKAENLLLSSTGQLKVCDFGFSLHCRAFDADDGDGGFDGSPMPLVCGTVDYMAPEYARATLSGPRATDHTHGVLDPHMHDLWAAGVILYFMLVGTLPFQGRTEEETLYKIAHVPPNLDAVESDGARSLLSRMLSSDPTDRLSIAEIIEDSWFSVGIDMGMFNDCNSRSLRQASVSHALHLPTGHHASASPSQSSAAGGFAAHLSICGQTLAAPSSAGSLCHRRAPRTFLDFSPSPSGDALDLLLSEAEHDAISDAFSIMDVDDDGLLSHDEIRDAILELNPNRVVPPTEVASIVRCFLPDGDGSIDLKGFTEVWVGKDLDHTLLRHIPYFRLRNLLSLVHAPVDPSIVRVVRSIFDQIDSNGDGFFTASDVEVLVHGGQHESISLPTRPAIPDATRQPCVGPANCLAPSISQTHSQGSSPVCKTQEINSGRCGALHISTAEVGGNNGTSVDATGIRELISYMDTKGSGTVIFDEFLTATVRSNVLLDHRVGSRLLQVIPQMAKLQSYLVSTGSRFTVSGSINSVTSRLVSYRPEHLLFKGSRASPASGSELLFDSYCPLNESGSRQLPSQQMAQDACSPIPNGHTTISPFNPGDLPGAVVSFSCADGVPARGCCAKGVPPPFSLHGNTEQHVGFECNAVRPGPSEATCSPPRPSLPEGISCRLSVRLTQLCEGFVGVFVTRISGRTVDYHDAMGAVMAAIQAEREQAIHETQPVGASELL